MVSWAPVRLIEMVGPEEEAPTASTTTSSTYNNEPGGLASTWVSVLISLGTRSQPTRRSSEAAPVGGARRARAMESSAPSGWPRSQMYQYGWGYSQCGCEKTVPTTWPAALRQTNW